MQQLYGVEENTNEMCERLYCLTVSMWETGKLAMASFLLVLCPGQTDVNKSDLAYKKHDFASRRSANLAYHVYCLLLRKLQLFFSPQDVPEIA